MDNHCINYYHRVLEQRFKYFKYIPSIFLLDLKANEETWAQNVDKYLNELMDSKFNFILTTHCDQDHWITVVLYRQQVVVLDSLGWNEKAWAPIMFNLTKFLKNKTRVDWIVRYDIPKELAPQKDGWSCGVWVCGFGELLCLGDGSITDWKPLVDIYKYKTQVLSRVTCDLFK